MPVVPYTPEAQVVIEAARARRCRVVGYVRCDSSGVPQLGVALPHGVDIDLPAGPKYRQYQQLVVIAALSTEEKEGGKQEKDRHNP
jgi:hypothetical protein